MSISFWAVTLPCIVAFATTLALVPQVRRFAIQCRVADKPNGRKVHAHAIPHLGGVAIFSGFFFGLLVSLGSPGGAALGDRLLALLPALLILFGLGLVDDLRGLRAGTKLLYQILGAALAVTMGAGFHEPGASWIALVGLAGLSVLWYVGACNSMNLIDGLDGLAAGTASLAAFGFLAVALRVGEPAVAVIALGLVGALVAFLRFNFHPARIFMGDTGSMFIGFALASLACILARHVGLWPALLGGAAMLGLPILDTASAICRRLAARRHIFEADGEHTHHRLMRAGLSHRGAVLVLYGLQAIFVLLGVEAMAGRFVAFGIAVVLAIGASIAISALARKAPVPVVDATAPAAVPLRAVPSPHDARPPVRVPARRRKADVEVLAELPPAAAGGGPS